MATKNILVHLSDNPETENRLRIAIDACQQYSAHLIAMYVHEIHFPVGAIGRGGYVAEDIEKVDEHAEHLRKHVSRLCHAAKISWEWVRSDNEHLQDILKHTSLADLTIVSQIQVDDLEDRLVYKFVEQLIMETGGPILVVPRGYKAKGIASPEKVMIAWKPAGESIRAVRDTLEIIKSAVEVTVFTADEEPETHDNPAEGILRYL